MLTADLLSHDPRYNGRYAIDVISGPQTGSEGSLVEEVRGRGVPLTILPELVRQISPAKDMLAIRKMTRIMRARRYAIVHTHSSKAGVLGRIAARLAKIPVIVHTVHGWSFHDYMIPWVRSSYIALERWVASFTNAMIVVTQNDIQKGLREGIGRPEQYHLIRSAIPLDEFDPAKTDREAARRQLGLPPEALVLGNVGRFSEQKNPLDWVRVAGRVGRALPECRFLLVGDGPSRLKVETALGEEGIAGRTVLTGLRRDVPEMLAAMDVFLLTSLWEGLPRTIPQALSMGVPVVASRVDGLFDAIQNGQSGYLLEPGDLEAMVVRCLELLEDPELRKKMGRVGREFVAGEFDLQQMIAQISSLYESLLENESMR